MEKLLFFLGVFFASALAAANNSAPCPGLPSTEVINYIEYLVK